MRLYNTFITGVQNLNMLPQRFDWDKPKKREENEGWSYHPCMFDKLPMYDAQGRLMVYGLSCNCPKCSIKC